MRLLLPGTMCVFALGITLVVAIVFHAFAPLDALPRM
jgi:hypothetical protein